MKRQTSEEMKEFLKKQGIPQTIKADESDDSKDKEDGTKYPFLAKKIYDFKEETGRLPSLSEYHEKIRNSTEYRESMKIYRASDDEYVPKREAYLQRCDRAYLSITRDIVLKEEMHEIIGKQDEEKLKISTFYTPGLDKKGIDLSIQIKDGPHIRYFNVHNYVDTPDARVKLEEKLEKHPDHYGDTIVNYLPIDKGYCSYDAYNLLETVKYIYEMEKPTDRYDLTDGKSLIIEQEKNDMLKEYYEEKAREYKEAERSLNFNHETGSLNTGEMEKYLKYSESTEDEDIRSLVEAHFQELTEDNQHDQDNNQEL